MKNSVNHVIPLLQVFGSLAAISLFSFSAAATLFSSSGSGFHPSAFFVAGTADLVGRWAAQKNAFCRTRPIFFFARHGRVGGDQKCPVPSAAETFAEVLPGLFRLFGAGVLSLFSVHIIPFLHLLHGSHCLIRMPRKSQLPSKPLSKALKTRRLSPIGSNCVPAWRCAN